MRFAGHRHDPGRRPGHTRSVVAALGAVLAALVLAACGGDEQGADSDASFDAARAFADLQHQVELGPRESGSPAARRTARFIADSLRETGAQDVRTQAPLRNVVATIPGEGEGYVVLGAHYDTKDGIPNFVGANDGASGVATILELARALPSLVPGPSIAIALFDGEEARGDRPFEADGMRGSRQYVALAQRVPARRQGAPPLGSITAMVLLDMVGDCDLEIPLESNSDQDLYRLIAAEAPEVFAGETIPIGDDHLPFLEAGIPAVNLIDFQYGPGPQPGAWWHSPRDTIDKVCAESLGAVGSAVERVLLRPDGLS